MNVKEYLNKVAYIGKSDIKGDEDAEVYYSKFDDSFITRVGLEDGVKYLASREITDSLTHGVGYSPKTKEWFGWSHRAIYGFSIGSTCKKGDCHYIGATLEDQEQEAITFWAEDYHLNTNSLGIVQHAGQDCFHIKWEYSDTIPNEKLRGTSVSQLHHVKPLGKGEWVAKTMEDAKQMAIDFNAGVS